jgi:hypothetical protein
MESSAQSLRNVQHPTVQRNTAPAGAESYMVLALTVSTTSSEQKLRPNVRNTKLFFKLK